VKERFVEHVLDDVTARVARELRRNLYALKTDERVETYRPALAKLKELGPEGPEPILTFRAYCVPKRSRLHWQVRWYRNATQMRRGYRAWARAGGRKTVSTHFQAITCHLKTVSYRRERPYHNPCLGVIFLHHKSCGAQVVSHEAVHAALYYFERLGLKHDDSTDERFAYVVSDLVGQICRRCW
jgi:hypothetical protein